MSKPSYVNFEAVKAAVNITQILERYGLAEQFKKSNHGDTWSGPCPIHKGTNSTQFRVSVSKNFWHSFGGDCHAHGNVLEFVSRMESVSISNAARKLAEWFQINSIKLRVLGVRRFVAIMGSILSPAQEELIVRHTTSNGSVLIMLDEKEAGRFGRKQMMMRLCAKLLVRVFRFDTEVRQPKHVTTEEVSDQIGGVA